MLQRDTSFFGRQPQKAPEPPNKAAPAAANPVTPAATRAAPPSDPAHAEENRKAARGATSGESQGSQLIVGPNIKLKGVEITDCDTLVVEGHVEATMDSRAIQIAQNGTFSGTAGIDVADIRGGFTGELTVRKCLTIHATGKVSGKIRYGTVVIEDGGEIGGDVKKLADEEKSVRIHHPAMPGKPGMAPAPAMHS